MADFESLEVSKFETSNPKNRCAPPHSQLLGLNPVAVLPLSELQLSAKHPSWWLEVAMLNAMPNLRQLEAGKLKICSHQTYNTSKKENMMQNLM